MMLELLVEEGFKNSVGYDPFFNKNEKKQALETLYTLNENFISQKYWVGKSYLLIAKIFISMERKKIPIIPKTKENIIEILILS